MTSPSLRRVALSPAAALLLLAACRPAAPLDAGPEPTPSAVQVAPAASARPAAAGGVATAASAATTASAAAATAASAPASASAAPAASAAPPAAPADPQNRSKPPLESDDLTGQARRLFDAIKADDPSLGADFFFPREPFIPLKDVKGAGKYWDQLYRTYEADIHKLHRQHKSDWADAQFEGFALGSAPGWVKPGEEANKIGYYRTFNGKLRYRAGGQPHTIDVRVIISWQNRWYITHLLPFKKH